MADKFKPGKSPEDYKKKREKQESEFQWKRAGRTIFLWIIFIGGAILLSQWLKFNPDEEVQLEYTQYRQLLNENKITKVIIIERELHGELNVDEPVPGNLREKTFRKFNTNIPPFYKEMEDDWKSHNIQYDFKKKDYDWVGILLNMLPWILLVFLWLFILRRMQSGGTRGIFSFGKSKAKLLTENKPKVTFGDVAGADEAKAELEEIIEFLKSPIKFQKLGGKIPKGALLLGAPGTGKTLLARAVAGEAEVPFFSMSGADFVEMFVGVGASRVRDLFEQGKKNAPCIIFIDEIDAVGRQRGAGLGGGHDEREQTLNQLLVEMDGFEHNEGVIIIAATNRPDVLDPALLRPGRFDRQIVIDRPDVRGREGILRVHTKKIPLAKNVDLSVLAKGTPGLAGADIANIVNEAALLAARRNKNKVDMEDFEESKDKVMMGMERRSLIITEDEKKSTAYHESGHVLVSKLIPECDPIHKVTIIPRGRALGVTTSLPIDERHTYSKDYCLAMLAKSLGGRAAELLVFKQLTTGAGNDIEMATKLARKMVCEWGMSENLGPLTFGKNEEEIFLGREISRSQDFSEKTSEIIDAEISTLVRDAQERANKLLKANIRKLHALADALLEREILEGFEINKIIDGKKLDKVRKKKVEKPKETKKETFEAAAKKPVTRAKPKRKSSKVGVESEFEEKIKAAAIKAAEKRKKQLKKDNKDSAKKK